MPTITRDSLMTLEAYAKARPGVRAQAIAHKKLRKVALGEHLTVLFEDEKTVRYQVQEMLRIERIFEEEGIEHELQTYNPLIPDGRNLKATMMIEYGDPDERRRELARLIGVEDKVWVQVQGMPKVYAIADEDLERADETKTSAVHFLRFELPAEQVDALKGGAQLAAGIDHPNYQVEISPVADNIRGSLLGDLD